MYDTRTKGYLDSTLYKMVFVLSGFRELYGASGKEKVLATRDLFINKIKARTIEDRLLLDFIDNGFILLDRDEVKAYSDYIAMLYDYPIKRTAFYNNLMDYAENQLPESLDGLLASEKARLKASAVVFLNALMTDIKVEVCKEGEG